MNRKKKNPFFYILVATLVALFIAVVAFTILDSLSTDSVIMAPGAPGVDYSDSVIY